MVAWIGLALPQLITFCFVLSVQVILCTKEVNEKCRLLAFQLLVAMANAAQRCSDKNTERMLIIMKTPPLSFSCFSLRDLSLSVCLSLSLVFSVSVFVALSPLNFLLSLSLPPNLGLSLSLSFLDAHTESVREFFIEVLAGLAGSPHMVAATIGCLSHLVFEFRGKQ